MFSKIFDWFYPPHCIVCGELLPLHHKDKWLCDLCCKKIPFLLPPFCSKCGAELEKEENKFTIGECLDCSHSSFAFEKGFSAFHYATVKKSIHYFKFRGVKKDGIGLAMLMKKFMEQNFKEEFMSYDFMLPVPIHPKKKKQRGFNQAEILTEELSKLTGMPWNPKLLYRTKNTKPQNALTPDERKTNIENAFAVSEPKTVENQKILLIDDIFTTGSTIHECAKCLLRAGANEVGFFALSTVAKEENREKEDR